MRQADAGGPNSPSPQASGSSSADAEGDPAGLLHAADAMYQAKSLGGGMSCSMSGPAARAARKSADGGSCPALPLATRGGPRRGTLRGSRDLVGRHLADLVVNHHHRAPARRSRGCRATTPAWAARGDPNSRNRRLIRLWLIRMPGRFHHHQKHYHHNSAQYTISFRFVLMATPWLAMIPIGIFGSLRFRENRVKDHDLEIIWKRA